MDDAAALLGALADPDRLRVAAVLILGETDVDGLVARTGLGPRRVEKGLTKLVSVGLVTKGRTGYRFVAEELQSIVREASERRSRDEELGLAPGGSDVLRRFIRSGRLVSIPTHRSKRLVVLDHLSQEFEPGFRYTEADVNEILAAYHDDVASLRRYLVDEGFMEREDGEYWRSGGTFFP